ncbi:MAG TPA: hypothetical protein VK502_03740, partial [Candidatus Saccharimonadales bacterium]|nr:hypothetical protein [Candidatus Saccharimonadales bacterium]
LIVMSVIVALLLGWWAWSYFGPKPLGDRLEYIGRKDYGMWLPLTSVTPGSTYYYGTDMSVKEVGKYFKGAEMVDTTGTLPDAASYSSQYLHYKNKNNSEKFLIVHYNDAQIIIKKNQLKNTTKKYILSVDSNDYGNTKDSL